MCVCVCVCALLQVYVETDPVQAAVDDPDSFMFTDVILYGAGWADGALALSDQVSVTLPPMRFRWVPAAGTGTGTSHPAGAASASTSATAMMQLPVYQDTTRLDYLFSIELPRPATLPAQVLVQRGVALVVWSPVRS
jgi:hypothetical protein